MKAILHRQQTIIVRRRPRYCETIPAWSAKERISDQIVGFEERNLGRTIVPPVMAPRLPMIVQSVAVCALRPLLSLMSEG